MNFESLGPSAAAVIVVLLFLNYLSSSNKRQDARDSVFAEALRDLTRSNQRVAKATETAAREAKERNGHLAEIAADNQAATMKALKTLQTTQRVNEQVVKHQTVETVD